MSGNTPLFTRPGLRLALVGVIAALAAALVLALNANIAARKQEAKQSNFNLVELNEKTVDPAVWGKNFPRQYDAYLRTEENYGTRFGGAGSEAVPISKLKEDPRLLALFDGYAFAIDYNQRRGHAHMLDDQRTTRRVTTKPQPGSCLHCHASTTVAYRQAGLQGGAQGTLDEPFLSAHAQEQTMKGFEAVGKLPYLEATKLVQHPVACIDCHQPESMQLRVTKPGFMRGIEALARSGEPVPHLPSIGKWRAGDQKLPYDPNRDASRQELRSMVCGQCHVEYYCGPKTTLFFPWNKGLKVEQIESYYDDYKFPDGHTFFDWKHARTGAELIKAQHPEFELWSQGIHARSGVACADCHMPYVREGAVKISDHHVQSPLRDISRACQTCHRFPEAELKARVDGIQERTHALLLRAEDAVVSLIDDVTAAKKNGLAEEKLAKVHALQRKAQFRVDFINAENSMGFHAPAEAARILAEAIDYGRQGQLALRDALAGKP